METAAAAPEKKGFRLPGLYLQVLIAIAAGAFIGWARPDWGMAFKPLGDGFVKLIKMIIAPIIFTTVAHGIASMGDLKKVGRVGGKALVYFEAMTTVALVLGLVIVHLVAPGAGVHASVGPAPDKALEATLATRHPTGAVEHLLALIPESFVGAFTQGDILQVLVLAILTGVALAGLKERAKPLNELLDVVTRGLFAIVNVIMRFAPLGAFGAMAFTIGKYGVDTLGSLVKLMAAFYATSLLFVFVVLGLVLRALGLSIFRLVAYLREELLLVLGTSSSESALPGLMTRLERLGCESGVVRLVIPAGYSFNLDGTCIYLTMAAMFVAQALDVPMSLGDQLSLLAVLLLTSKGAAGVTGSGFVTLAATLATTGSIPVAGLTLLLGVDRFMSEARALTNFVGNAVATIVVSRWEQGLDTEKAKAVLAGRQPGPAPAVVPPDATT